MPDREYHRPGWRRSGIEHEFSLFRGDEQVDARALLPTLQLGGRHLDPGDPRAQRCAWGGVITADGKEIELATPPMVLGVHGPGAALRMAEVGQAHLRAGLPGGLRVVGYSTHLNIEMHDRRARRTALLLARRFGPALGLLLDRAESPGLLVRPRYRRMELGGEYADGDTLRAAWTFAIGAVVACEAAAHARARRGALPPELRLTLQPTPERFGWFVGRAACGTDLYAAPRTGVVRRAGGGSMSARSMLATAWECARPYAALVAGDADLALVDDRVHGRSPLPCEHPTATSPTDPPPSGGVVPFALPSPIDERRRGSIRIVPVAATWYALVLRIDRAGHERWVHVPGDTATDFLAELDGGELDQWLDTLLPTEVGS